MIDENRGKTTARLAWRETIAHRIRKGERFLSDHERTPQTISHDAANAWLERARDLEPHEVGERWLIAVKLLDELFTLFCLFPDQDPRGDLIQYSVVQDALHHIAQMRRDVPAMPITYGLVLYMRKHGFLEESLGR